MNPLFNALGGGQMPGNMGQMVQAFQKFKSEFQGNPEEEVKKLLQSGRMSQGQLDQLQQMARQLQQFMG